MSSSRSKVEPFNRLRAFWEEPPVRQQSLPQQMAHLFKQSMGSTRFSSQPLSGVLSADRHDDSHLDVLARLTEVLLFFQAEEPVNVPIVVSEPNADSAWLPQQAGTEYESVFVEQWRAVSELLKQWHDDPESAPDLDDPDPDPPPSKHTVEEAGKLAASMVKKGWVAPDRIVATPRAGISFYRFESDDVLTRIRLLSDGRARLMRSQRGKILQSGPLPEAMLSEDLPIWDGRSLDG